jgi:ribonucleoside-diphosphate reductase alpha chain
MGWIQQDDGTLLHEETGTIYGPDSPVYFNIYEHEGKAVVFIANEEIPDGVDPREYVQGGKPSNIETYFDGDKMRHAVWNSKFKRKGAGHPGAMFNLLATQIYTKELQYPNPISQDKIYEMINNFKYVLPGGSILYGVGNDLVSTSNCFVIANPYDSYGGILHTDQEMIQLMKRRGGVGFGLDNIRPAHSAVKNAAATSTGLVSFMERYSNSTQEVAQGGRRGALMLSLPLEHRDAADFIMAKLDHKKVNGANVSVRVNDSQMLRYVDYLRPKPKPEKGGLGTSATYTLSSSPGSTFNNSTTNQLGTTELINLIAEAQLVSAEPGLLFWDRILRESPADCYAEDGFETTGTNPCAELPLAPYDSCRLLHMNLLSYVDKPFQSDAEFDFEKLGLDVIIAQRLLDDVIDIEIDNINSILKKIDSDPEPIEIKQLELDMWGKIKQKAISGRRTGLGHTGIADVFAALGIPYGSSESIQLGIRIQKEISFNSYKSSIIMAKERGAFPVFSHVKESNHLFIEKILTYLDDEQDIISIYNRYGRRNIANLTIAPTGTVSLLAGVSSGIEPVFDICYLRKVKKTKSTRDEWDEYRIVHPGFKLWYNTIMKSQLGVDIDSMSNEQIDELVKSSPYYGSLANDIDPQAKLKLVGGMQEYIDHAISVTHNLPKKTTVDTIKNIIVDAFLLGCKGITVYVDGSRDGVLKHNEDEDKVSTFSRKDAIKRPTKLKAEIHITTISSLIYCVAIGILDGSPYEVFAFTVDKPEIIEILKNEENTFEIVKVRSGRYDLNVCNKDGKHIYTISKFNKSMDADGEVVCRILSTALRHGVDITFLYEQIQAANTEINNFARAVSRTFKKYINTEKINRKDTECPICKTGKLVFQEGCVVCNTCGHSKCAT